MPHNGPARESPADAVWTGAPGGPVDAQGGHAVCSYSGMTNSSPIMYTKKFTIAGIFCSLMATLSILFPTTPQNAPDLKNTYRASGTIEKIVESGANNVVLKLENDDRMYYLELDLTRERSVADIRHEFVGKPVEIYYEKQQVSPTNRPGIHHIARVNLNRTPIF